MSKYRVHVECAKTLPETNSLYVQCLSYVVGAPPRALPGQRPWRWQGSIMWSTTALRRTIRKS